MLGFWVGFTGLQLLLGWYAFRLDRESPRVLWAMPLQQFVYRQLMYLVVIESVLTAIQGTRLHWRPIARRGEIEVDSPESLRIGCADAEAGALSCRAQRVVGERALRGA